MMRLKRRPPSREEIERARSTEREMIPEWFRRSPMRRQLASRFLDHLDKFGFFVWGEHAEMVAEDRSGSRRRKDALRAVLRKIEEMGIIEREARGVFVPSRRIVHEFDSKSYDFMLLYERRRRLAGI